MVREIWAWKKGSFARVMLAIMGTAITAGAVIWAVAIVGTPRVARMRELDYARVADLQRIKTAIEEFYRDKGILPDNLHELDLEADDLRDPETGEKYGYVIEDATHYRISARFSLSGEESKFWYDEDWSHGSGVHEFSFVIPERDKQRDDHIMFTRASSQVSFELCVGNRANLLR